MNLKLCILQLIVLDSITFWIYHLF